MYYPAQVANNYLQTGQTKASLPGAKTFVLALMAGVFLGMGAAGSSTAASLFENPSFARLISGALFPTALLMVLIAGAELFTGNTLLVIPLYERKITLAAMLRNWLIVYAGNFMGALLVVLLLWQAGQWGAFSGGIAVYAIKTAATKIGYGFGKALLLGIGCNFMVCIAVWMTYAADSVGGKLAGMYLPIALFVILGFEHSIANMYYIPAGLLAASNSVWAAEAAAHGVDTSLLTLHGFLFGNLIPATIGNIIGGALCVGTPYWYAYVRQPRGKAQQEKQAA